jgi:hypothetical protein
MRERASALRLLLSNRISVRVERGDPHGAAVNKLSGMISLRVIIPLSVFVLRVIFSENRFPLFGITR